MTTQPAAHVLVAEDEYLTAALFARTLRDAGYTVIGPAARLSQAFDLLRNDGIDVALLDINLEGERTFPLADELLRRKIPLFFVSGYGQEVLPDRFRPCLMINKPCLSRRAPRAEADASAIGKGCEWPTTVMSS